MQELLSLLLTGVERERERDGGEREKERCLLSKAYYFNHSHKMRNEYKRCVYINALWRERELERGVRKYDDIFNS